MASKFFPERLIYVIASGGHPPKTEYRVGIGPEHWDTPVLVKKVQMVYENKIAGRVSPSYPIHSEFDERAVLLAMSLLDEGEGTNTPYQKIVATVARLSPDTEFTLDQLTDQQEDRVHNFYIELAPAMTIVEACNKKIIELGNGLYGIIFEVNFRLQL